MDMDYLKTLLLQNRDVGERYRMKLSIVNGLDPFTINTNEINYSLDGVPPITNMDIVAYLVLTHSFYTKEQMKAFKSLQAYKYFEAGFVEAIGTKLINEFYILVGKVKHSQRANIKSLNVWCVVAKDGGICTAHCTCMAGNSEVCSHVGAILFAAEYAHTKKESLSCTDIKAKWPMPSSTHVPIVPIREMDWGNPLTINNVPSNVAPITKVELEEMLQNIQIVGQSSALMRIVEPFASELAEKAQKNIPSPFQLFDATLLDKGYEDLVKLSKSMHFVLSSKEISDIEESTRNQAQNANWFTQRAGRITASKFKTVCQTNMRKPSLTLIKSICYPTKYQFFTKSTSWGISRENVAVAKYEKMMTKEHECFQINDVGVLVNKEWPQFGASPDRLVYCECCLGGCLEVKCPYLLYTNNIQNLNEYLKMKNCCLIKDDGKITLNKNHSYYFQMQMQIFVSQLIYCDFVIWSPNIFFKERITKDVEFWNKNSKIAINFHSEVIMPELLGRYFTRNAGVYYVNRWCICEGVDDGRPMIKCDGDDCETEWFHFDCVNLNDLPNHAWYCNKCNI